MRLVLYTNILTPYRKYTYDLFYRLCRQNGDDFHVIVMAKTEGNRSWTYDELKAEYTILLKGKTISFDETYIHWNYTLAKQLRTLKPDIVVCAGSYLCPGVWEVARLKKKLQYKCLFWSESHLNEFRNYDSLKRIIRDTIRRKFYKKYDGFWYAGRLSREFIEKYASENAKYFFMPNLVEEHKYKEAGEISRQERDQRRRQLGIDYEKTMILCPARLSPVKGILEFLDLLSKTENSSKVQLIIAGTGELKEKIEKRAAEKRLDVRLVGFQAQEKMLRWYSVADIFLMPSLSDPNPLTCIEALWAGLPLLISNHCGNYPEVIEEGENGYVFEYEKSEEAVEKIDYLLDSSAEWRIQAGKFSRMKAEERYHSEKVVKNLLATLHEKIIKESL